jgi:ribonucleoside-triphosphate reductase (thioredoxin)
VVVEVPIDAGVGVRTSKQVSMWEQLSLAALLQRHWADNQVSCTVTFDPNTEAAQLESALHYFQYQLKGVSFLPRIEKGGAYLQMPYEEITEAEYNQRVAELTILDLDNHHEQATPEKGCNNEGGSCSIIRS